MRALRCILALLPAAAWIFATGMLIGLAFFDTYSGENSTAIGGFCSRSRAPSTGGF